MPDDKWFTDVEPVTELDFARAEARLWRGEARKLEARVKELEEEVGLWRERAFTVAKEHARAMSRVRVLEDALSAQSLFPGDLKARDEPAQNRG